MMSSYAAGRAVVTIDSSFWAAMAADRIARIILGAKGCA
jgi:NCAIR mutase (PurE)-related protein